MYRSMVGFTKNESGATVMLFGLAFIPVMLFLGVGVDMTRATMVKSEIQNAVDAAVLAIASDASKNPSSTAALRRERAITAVRANLGHHADQYAVVADASETSSDDGTTYTVTANAKVPNSIMRIVRLDYTTLRVSADARATGVGDVPVEIALALDNTGSMANDMPKLISAAKTLAQDVMKGNKSNIRVSVVPYVTAVNPGPIDLSFIDTTGQSPFRGAGGWMSGVWNNGQWIAFNTGCVQNWGSGGGGGPGGSGSGDGGASAYDLQDMINPFRKMALELFGILPAAAQVTPNTIPVVATNSSRSPRTGRTYRVPIGFGTVWRNGASTGGCEWLTGPNVVAAYELFPRTRDEGGNPIRWKGCVEARATREELTWLNNNAGRGIANVRDYDVTDEPPTPGNIATQFAPYFWGDESDYDYGNWSSAAPGPFTGGKKFHNNWLRDPVLPAAWGWTANLWSNSQNILKYDGTTRAAIVKETGPDSYGPNANCPEPLTRLTSNQGQVISALNQMTHWNNGGTITSEGLMWAWRTLSPNAPFKDGAAYGTPGVRKSIVLFTDGINGLNDNGNSSSGNLSDYGAYGYLGGGRLAHTNGLSTYARLEEWLDQRLLKACTNAKAAGITIYTVLFNGGSQMTAAMQTKAANLLRQCASTPEAAYLATDTTSLTNAFSRIGVDATKAPVRLSR